MDLRQIWWIWDRFGGFEADLMDLGQIWWIWMSFEQICCILDGFEASGCHFQPFRSRFEPDLVKIDKLVLKTGPLLTGALCADHFENEFECRFGRAFLDASLGRHFGGGFRGAYRVVVLHAHFQRAFLDAQFGRSFCRTCVGAGLRRTASLQRSCRPIHASGP